MVEGVDSKGAQRAGFVVKSLPHIKDSARVDIVKSGYKQNGDTGVLDGVVCFAATESGAPEGIVTVGVTQDLVKIGGRFIAMKGKNAEFELQGAKRAISLLGGRDVTVEEISLTGSDEVLTHPLIVIAKKEKTPQTYPRPYAQICKKPL